MRCPRCGALLRDDAEQCGFCGEKIVPVVSFEKPIIENRPRDEAFDVENTVRKKEVPEQQDHDQNPWIIAIIILSGVMIAVIGVLLFYTFKNRQRAVVNVNPSAAAEATADTIPAAPSKQEPDESASETPEAQETEAPESGNEEEAQPGPDESQPGAAAQTAAYDDREADGIIYRVSGNQAVVLRCISRETSITIAEEIDGIPVVGVSESAFSGCGHLVYIDLPEGIAWIGANAFMDCRNFRGIVMPDTLVTLGDHSFDNCPSFTVISHEAAYGHAFAEFHSLKWLEGDSLTPLTGEPADE